MQGSESTSNLPRNDYYDAKRLIERAEKASHGCKECLQVQLDPVGFRSFGLAAGVIVPVDHAY